MPDPYKHQRHAARNSQLPCSVPRCQNLRRKSSRFCGSHELHATRHGHPTERVPKKREIVAFINHASSFLDRMIAAEASLPRERQPVAAAIELVCRWVEQAALSRKSNAEEHLARLHDRAAKPRLILAALIGVSHMNTLGAFNSNEVHRTARAYAVFRLEPFDRYRTARGALTSKTHISRAAVQEVEEFLCSYLLTFISNCLAAMARESEQRDKTQAINDALTATSRQPLAIVS